MRKVCGLGIALVLVLGLSGCGASGPEANIKEGISLMNEISGHLESIKDNETADAAIPKIEKASERMGQLGKQMKDQKMSKEEEEKLKEKYKKEMETALSRMMTASIAAAKNAPGKAKEIQAALQKGGKGL